MNKPVTYLPIRPEWLITHREEAIDPAVPVIDAHHHLYDRPQARYLLDEFLQDVLESGHQLCATVFVQARAMLRQDASELEQPLGETEFANGMAAMSSSGIYGKTRVCAAIVGYADLLQGDAIRTILERHIAVAGGPAEAGGRFRGVRQSLTWDADASLINPAYPLSEDMMDSTSFRKGFSHLAPLDLSFEAWTFFHQLPRVAALARAFPQTRIVLNHCGGILGIGAYANRRDEVFQIWRQGIQELGRCPNVMVKLSGLGMRLNGFGAETASTAPSSGTLASAWQPYIETCIEAFGSARCMYGSNFPVDKGTYSYGIGLNALKRLTSSATAEEQADVFWRSASAFYRIPMPPFGESGQQTHQHSTG